MKFIVKYISQKTIGYSDNFKKIKLRCKVKYNDGSVAVITETHSNVYQLDRFVGGEGAKNEIHRYNVPLGGAKRKTA